MSILRLRRTEPLRARSLASALAGLALATMGLVGCGDDAGDSGDDGEENTPDASTTKGDATATKPDAGGSSSTKPPKTFVVGCKNTREETCDEYLGDTKNEDTIKESVDDLCKQAGEEVASESCSTSDLVGSCLSLSEYDGVEYWVKTFYYAPLTETAVKGRCQGGTFEAAP